MVVSVWYVADNIIHLLIDSLLSRAFVSKAGRQPYPEFLHGIINWSEWVQPYIANQDFVGVTQYQQFCIYRSVDTGEVRIQARKEVDRGP